MKRSGAQHRIKCRTHIAVALGALVISACAGLGKHGTGRDDENIPGKNFFQFAKYEHVCELTMDRDFSELEQLFDRYGDHGWRLAGFINKKGESYAFCMVR